MHEKSRCQGMILATTLLLVTSGMNALASDSDEAPLVVPGDTNPSETEPVFDENRMLKMSPSDTESALHIILPETSVPKKLSQPGEPLQVGFERHLPEEHQKDLVPQMDWITLDDGTLAGTVSVTSPGALSMRMGAIADLPPGGEMRFIGLDAEQQFPVITRKDIVWKGQEPEVLWSPVVVGDTITAEIVLPSEEARSSFLFEIDRISHIYAQDGGFGYAPTALDCTNHVDALVSQR